jgi:hypothetical protein
MSENDYFKKRAVSASLIKECLKSPLHGYAFLNEPREQTAAMALGSLVHALVLEPETASFHVLPKGKRTTPEDLAEAGSKMIVREQQLEEAKQIASSVLSSPVAKELLKGAKVEVSLSFDVDGTPCKSKIDAVNGETLIELKTANDLYARDFASTIIRNDYHTQLAFYREALRRNGHNIKRVVVIQATTDAPFICRVFELEDLYLDAGDRRINKVFDVAAKLIEGWKPEQPTQTEKLMLPEWAKEML